MAASLRCHLLHVVVAVLVLSIGIGRRCLGKSVVLSLNELEWGAQKIRHSRAEPPGVLGKNTAAMRARGGGREGGAAATIVLELKRHSATRTPSSSDHAGVHELYLHGLLASDDARAASLHRRLASPQSGEAEAPLTSGIRLQTLNYVTTIALGGANLTVIVDTGSDLTWVQCKPCTSCYAQHDPLLDPAASGTYAAVTCNSTACTVALRAATGAPGACGSDGGASCSYALGYGDGSYTSGVLAMETAGFGGADVERFVFGCGLSNRGLFGGTSGLMGLGRSELSVVSQTAAQFGGVFSYCLPAALYNSSGSLALGGDASTYRNATPVAYTGLLADAAQAPFYFVNMTGATVGGVALRAEGFGRRVVVDSGTVVTRLPPSVYRAARAEVARRLAAYPAAPGFSILDTCYNLTGQEEAEVPQLRLQFEGGVDMAVEASGMFLRVRKDGSQVCLALASLASEDEVGILGNHQQKNWRVVYDTAGSRIGFAQEDCSFT